MGLSQLALSIAESPTLKLNEEARILRAKGEAVIHLGIGEPKNKTPEAAIARAAALLNQGDVKYSSTDGTPGLKQAILRYTEENYGRRVTPANVIVSSGAKQSLFNLLYALLDPQDEVVLLAPYWVSYPEITRMCRGVPVVVTAADGGFRPSLAEVERAVTPRTKAVICNSPNNPSGVMYDEGFIQGLVGLCERRDIYLVMDDIYHKLVFDGRQALSAWRFTDRDVERTKVVLVNGVAKTYGMTGFRIGWAVASRELVAVMTNIQSQTTTCSSHGAPGGRRGRAERRPGRGRDAAARDAGEPRPGAAGARRDPRGQVREAGRHVLLPARLQRPSTATRCGCRSSCSSRRSWSPCPAGSSAWRATCGSPTRARRRTWWRPSRA